MKNRACHFPVRLTKVLAVFALWATVTTLSAEPSEEEQRFITAAREAQTDLATFAKPVQKQGRVLRETVGMMLQQYEEICELGPCPRRDELVRVYEGDRPTAIADQENLATAIRALEPAIQRAIAFVDRHAQYRHLDAWKRINSLTLDAGIAIETGRRIPRPPPLPDPLPNEAASLVTITDVRSAIPDADPGQENQLIVTLKSNRRYSSKTVTVEVKVREGQASITPPLEQTVTVDPQETVTLTWNWRATSSGQSRVGARIRKTEEAAQVRVAPLESLRDALRSTPDTPSATPGDLLALGILLGILLSDEETSTTAYIGIMKAFSEIRAEQHRQLVADVKELKKDPRSAAALKKANNRIHKKEVEALKTIQRKFASERGERFRQAAEELSRQTGRPVDSSIVRAAVVTILSSAEDGAPLPADLKTKETETVRDMAERWVKEFHHSEADVLRDGYDEIKAEVQRLKK